MWRRRYGRSFGTAWCVGVWRRDSLLSETWGLSFSWHMVVTHMLQNLPVTCVRGYARLCMGWDLCHQTTEFEWCVLWHFSCRGVVEGEGGWNLIEFWFSKMITVFVQFLCLKKMKDAPSKTANHMESLVQATVWYDLMELDKHGYWLGSIYYSCDRSCFPPVAASTFQWVLATREVYHVSTLKSKY